jgi:hypothetical protein
MQPAVLQRELIQTKSQIAAAQSKGAPKAAKKQELTQQGGALHVESS